MAKLRNGWKSHGTSWKFNETPCGGSIVSVVQFTERGQKRFEAHYWDDRICGFANSPSDFWRTKKFDSREDAFIFCEGMYGYYLKRKSENNGG